MVDVGYRLTALDQQSLAQPGTRRTCELLKDLDLVAPCGQPAPLS
jgi:hypothetical protein